MGENGEKSNWESTSPDLIEAILHRRCPVCEVKGLNHLSSREISLNMYNLYFDCSCGAKFSTWIFMSQIGNPAVLSVRVKEMPGWKSCLRCGYEYDSTIRNVGRFSDDARVCPGCGYPDQSSTNNGPEFNMESLKNCFLCGGPASYHKYRSSCEFRDGSMGDYQRTTALFLTRCAECRRYNIIETVESNKFGPVTRKTLDVAVPDEIARRLVFSYGFSIGNLSPE